MAEMTPEVGKAQETLVLSPGVKIKHYTSRSRHLGVCGISWQTSQGSE